MGDDLRATPSGPRAGDRPSVSAALLIARLFLAVIYLAHGAQGLLGSFGGPGLAGAVKFLGPVAYPVVIGQFFGALGLLVGFLSRFSAFWLIVIMGGAIVMVHARNGFFAPGGIEYPLTLIGLLLLILIVGPGRFSAARWLRLPAFLE